MLTYPHRSQQTIYYDRKLRQQARQLRKHPTTAEQLLWQQLRSRKLGYKFRRQHALHGFIVDFYCYELMLIIEVDGSIHDHQQERDQLKDQKLTSHHYKVLRFKNHEIANNLAKVINIIKCYLTKTPS